jgi:hypothetical protein
MGSAYIGLALLRDWAAHDYFLSAAAERRAEQLVRLGLAAALLGGLGTADPAGRVYAASVFFLLLMGREVSHVAARLAALRDADPDAPVYFSPFVVPVRARGRSARGGLHGKEGGGGLQEHTLHGDQSAVVVGS